MTLGSTVTLMRLVHGWVVHCGTIIRQCKLFMRSETLTDLPILDGGPFEAFDVNAESKQGREYDDSLESESLAFVVLRLGRPVQEGDDVLGHLRRRGRGACETLGSAQ